MVRRAQARLAAPPTVGGGGKKVLYTLATVRRIGLRNSARALSTKNACKACGLGMGGQRGGMTNELGEFPAVCNKSIQAQSTDIQPPIPAEVFRHSLAELRELDGQELEQLGRLGFPIYKPAGESRYRPVDWDFALALAARRFAASDPSRTFFYCSGRSSNEAGFLLQLLARVYGTNNVNNCSYYCHQATAVGLGSTIGTGTSTVELADLTACDLIFVIGANPASNHPRLIHKLAECRARGGDVIVINPAREPGLVRFAIPKSLRSMLSGGDWIASDYLQPRIGSDVAVFKGLAKAVLAAGGEDREFIDGHTENFSDWWADIEATSWTEIEAATGLAQAELERVAAIYCRSRNAIFAWGMGLTHHLDGVANVEALACLALLRGMVGRPHAGLLPLRGHSNIQGIGTVGVKPALPADMQRRLEQYFDIRLPPAPGYDTLQGLLAAGRGDIDAALFLGGNLLAASPAQDWTRHALERIGFKLFLTTTLNMSHVCGVDAGESLVLPVTARDEEWQPTTQESMFNYVRLSDGGIDRLDNVRPETVILSELADRMLGDAAVDFSAFRQLRKVRAAIAATVPGMEALADIDATRREFHVGGRILHRPEFPTASGRASFRVVSLKPSATSDAFPWLMTTMRSEGQFNNMLYEQRDAYRLTEDRWVVLMNAADIRDLGLSPGQRADLVSAHGRMSGVRLQTFDLPRGSVMAYFPEANVLTANVADARSQTPAFKATPVRVEAAAGGNF